MTHTLPFFSKQLMYRLVEIHALGLLLAGMTLPTVLFAIATHYGLRTCAIVSAAAVIEFYALIYLVIWPRYREIPRPLLILIPLVWGVAVYWAPMAYLNLLQHPQLIEYNADDCRMFTEAYEKDHVPEKDRSPCRYQAYLFPATNGGMYAYGVSENVKDQCVFLGMPVLDIRHMNADTSLPAMSELPAKCAATLGEMVKLSPPRTW